MKTIVNINKFSQAIPGENIWYKYYDDIFISVTNHKTPHIRRYSKNENDKKNDNRLSYWHSFWQYNLIEDYYRQLINKKTYEIAIKFNNEIHIIDSLVENIAIEFQHTLNVSLSEINSRFIAHKSNGFIPYLVIDLSEYDSEIANKNNLKINNILTKFKKSDYYVYNNLFVDFNDIIIRYCSNVKDSRLEYTKDYIVKNLLKLESEYELEKEKEIKRQELLIIENKKNDKENNNLEKYSHDDFKYWRFCLKNINFKEIVKKYSNDFIECLSLKYLENEYEIKEYFYKSKDNDFNIVVKEFRNKYGKYIRTEYLFFWLNPSYTERIFISDLKGIIETKNTVPNTGCKKCWFLAD